MTVKFYIKNKVYTVGNVVFPKDGSQLVWCKWHTPKTEQTVNIKVTATGGASVSNANISAKIVDLLHFDINIFFKKIISTERDVQC